MELTDLIQSYIKIASYNKVYDSLKEYNILDEFCSEVVGTDDDDLKAVIDEIMTNYIVKINGLIQEFEEEVFEIVIEDRKADYLYADEDLQLDD